MRYVSSRLPVAGILAAALCLPAFADENRKPPGADQPVFYFTAFGGYGPMDLDAAGTVNDLGGAEFSLETELSAGTVFGGSLGYRFNALGNAVRVEGEAAYRENKIDGAFATVDGQDYAPDGVTGLEGRIVESLSVMVNGWYDFDSVDFALKPFVGAGVGGAMLSSVSPFDSHDEHVFGLAYQLGGGVRYPFLGNWSLDLHYRFFATKASEDMVDDSESGLGAIALDRTASRHEVMLALTVPLWGGGGHRGRGGALAPDRYTVGGSEGERRRAAMSGQSGGTEAPPTPSKRSRMAAAAYPEDSSLQGPGPGHEPTPRVETGQEPLPTPAQPPAGQEPANRGPSIDDFMVSQNARSSVPPAPGKPPAAAVGPAKGRPESWVQLGTANDVAQANRLWREVWSRDRTRLKGLQPRILRVRTSGTGVLYHVQVGPLPRKSATALCSKLVSPCVVADR